MTSSTTPAPVDWHTWKKLIQDVEHDPASGRLQRFKRSDDIAAVLLAPERLGS